MPRWTRRDLLAAAAASALSRPVLAKEAPPARVAALDWTLASTLMALGVTPVGVAEQRLYADWVGPPALPSGVIELGLRTGPSFETLAALKPDLIGINPLNESIRSRLEMIAPTFSNSIFSPERAPLDRCKVMTRSLADRIGAQSKADALIERTDAILAAVRQRLAGAAPRPLLPLNILDARHFNLYGRGSLYADVLRAVGLVSAFDGPTSSWGNAAVGIEALADLPRCDLLVIAPVPHAALRMFEGPSLWSKLLAAKGTRRIMLPAAWAFGDLAAASRFAVDLADAFTAEQARPL
ncbi:iron-siderophore ABC transporter substrate-binding protein [Lichenifustis flavocetrariae]|uniref:Iron-siderophore ABC transporter substrate-binding protein n=1 Tax=Lichenifustis flavocetrariae TaxID=2949735 RepID=A0AA41YXV1_9HYPH|nr:iron-siderophore ABC transporter substrate-binding protein [Lichenifustis flavocetrariae]MCW6509202.1 iron-siderophore ABC transporter substrate-binding protein [Lichenifustis flavocetrariae]